MRSAEAEKVEKMNHGRLEVTGMTFSFFFQMRQQELYEMLKEKLDKFDHDEQMKEIAEDKKKKDFNKALRNQLEDATSKAAKKEEEFQKDKAMIDEIVGTIEKEEIQYVFKWND
jgi:hypothetical protein